MEWADSTEQGDEEFYNRELDLEPWATSSTPAEGTQNMASQEELRQELANMKARLHELVLEKQYTEHVLQTTQDQLKDQVQINQGLKKELSRETGQKELLQTVKDNLQLRLNKQFEVNKDLKKQIIDQKHERVERIKVEETRKALQKVEQELEKQEGKLKIEIQRFMGDAGVLDAGFCKVALKERMASR